MHDEDAVASHDNQEVGDGRIRDKEFFASKFSVGRAQLNGSQVPVRTVFDKGNGGANLAATDGGELLFFAGGRADGIQN